MRQERPFHRSTSAPALDPPTATQLRADGHATPLKTAPPDGGLGVGWTIHEVPFQRSASVPEFEAPTAVQAEADEHMTPWRKAPRDGGLGVGWIRQERPFHRSTSVCDEPARVKDSPTAVQADADQQETANSALFPDAGGFRVGCTAQRCPFHRSDRVTVLPKRMVTLPTAVHRKEPEHETPNTVPVRAGGFGLGTLDHPNLATAGCANESWGANGAVMRGLAPVAVDFAVAVVP